MAPPLQPFPVSELETRVLSTTHNFKEKSRKLPKDFDLKRDCELLELVQYSCTTPQQIQERQKWGPTARTRVECWPFVRLYRRCGEGANMFHVETTAWEGEHKWEGLGVLGSQGEEARKMKLPGEVKVEEKEKDKQSVGWAKYVDAFWAQK